MSSNTIDVMHYWPGIIKIANEYKKSFQWRFLSPTILALMMQYVSTFERIAALRLVNRQWCIVSRMDVAWKDSFCHIDVYPGSRYKLSPFSLLNLQRLDLTIDVRAFKRWCPYWVNATSCLSFSLQHLKISIDKNVNASIQYQLLPWMFKFWALITLDIKGFHAPNIQSFLLHALEAKPKLKSLSVHLPSTTTFEDVDILVKKCPSLTSLVVYGASSSPDTDISWHTLCRLIASSRTLTSISVPSTMRGISGVYFYMPTITSLSCSPLFFNVHSLYSFPNLQTLSLESTISSKRHLCEHDIHTWSCLLRLNSITISVDYYAEFLPSILQSPRMISNLTHLDIQSLDDMLPQDILMLPNLVHLQSLGLSCCCSSFWTPDILFEIGFKMPRVSKLSLRYFEINHITALFASPVVFIGVYLLHCSLSQTNARERMHLEQTCNHRNIRLT